jgi:hypothetical protein
MSSIGMTGSTEGGPTWWLSGQRTGTAGLPGGELRPVRRDRRVEVQLATLGEAQRADGHRALGRRRDHLQRAAGVGIVAASRPPTHTLHAAPTSPRSAKFASNTSRTRSNPGATLPFTSAAA